MRRILTLLLASILLCTVLSGCAKQEADAQTDPGLYALDAYAPDAVVMTIDGSEVRWDEFAFWLCSTAKQFAEEAGVPFVDELHRILIHGVLHLTGQGDKTPETKAQMTAKENQALCQLNDE